MGELCTSAVAVVLSRSVSLQLSLGKRERGQGSPTLWELGMCQGCCLKGQRLKKLRRKLQE